MLGLSDRHLMPTLCAPSRHPQRCFAGVAPRRRPWFGPPQRYLECTPWLPTTTRQADGARARRTAELPALTASNGSDRGCGARCRRRRRRRWSAMPGLPRRRSEGDALFPARSPASGSPACGVGRHSQRPGLHGVHSISFTVHPLGTWRPSDPYPTVRIKQETHDAIMLSERRRSAPAPHRPLQPVPLRRPRRRPPASTGVTRASAGEHSVHLECLVCFLFT
jgi:hypothetical protein